jgi:uracil-DNA glycosylase family 4
MVCRPERCENCPFITPTVGTKGPEDSPFVIVGESPGTNELRAGLPFVGESGKLLNAVLNQAGLPSLGIEPYVINALSCYPPPKAKEKGMDKMIAATKACQSRLVSLIQAHPRKVILCLGASASWAVTGNYGIKITQKRGQIIPTPLAEHGAVLAVHPAFLMRQGGGLPFWKKDLACAVKLLRGESISGWSEPTWSVVDRPSDLLDLISDCHKAEFNTSDLETDQLHWFGGRILCAGVTNGSGDHVNIIPEDVIYKNLPLMARLYESGRWNWHNSLFDVTWLRAPQHNIQAYASDDTMLQSYSLNENRGFHDLDQVAQHVLGAPPHKHMVSKYLPNKKASYRNIPPAELHKYCAIDLSKQHKIFKPLQELQAESPESVKLYTELLMPAVPEIVELRLQGVRANREKVEANETLLQTEIEELDEKINEYAIQHMGTKINVASPQQLAQLLYDHLQLKIPGTRSTDEDTIIQLQRRYDHPIFNLILNRRKLAKEKGTYVTNLLYGKKGKNLIPGAGHIKPDGRVYPDFRLHGTTTGRLAGSDPNLLNQPRSASIRGQYEAEPGHLFVEVDENQAELRSLAVMSGDPLLCDIYTKNEVSIHDITTAKFYGSKKEMINDPETMMRAAHLLQYFGVVDNKDWTCYDCNSEVIAHQKHLCGQRVYKEAKMRGKAVNFGIVYGREAYSLAMEFNISVAEADRWIQEWMALYSGAADFIKWCRSRPLERKDLVTAFGRKKRHGVVSREALKGIQNEAANFPHQSTASDIMLMTLIRCGPQLRAWGCRPWLELYDAIYFQAKIDEEVVAKGIKLVQDTITQVPIDYGITRIPFIGDAKIGFDWGHMKEWKGSIAETLGDELKTRLVAAP